MNDVKLIELFETHRLEFTLHNHAPVFSAQDDCPEMTRIPGAHSKNLFLKDKKNHYALVSVLEHKKVDLKILSEQLERRRFSFCNSDELLNFIGVLPGSVTPFGLIHDSEKRVDYFLDEEFLTHSSVNFHPLRNDQTVNMKTPAFLNFFEVIGHPLSVIAIPNAH